MVKKSFTLAELIIAASLLVVIIAGTLSFDLASKMIFRTSQRKTEVLNELALVLDHLHKNVLQGTGTVKNPPLEWNGSVLTIHQEGGDVNYHFNVSAHEITFEGETLSRRLTNLNLDVNNGRDLCIDNVTLAYNPNDSEDPYHNPRVSAKEIFFSPLSQSIN